MTTSWKALLPAILIAGLAFTSFSGTAYAKGGSGGRGGRAVGQHSGHRSGGLGRHGGRHGDRYRNRYRNRFYPWYGRYGYESFGYPGFAFSGDSGCGCSTAEEPCETCTPEPACSTCESGGFYGSYPYGREWSRHRYHGREHGREFGGRGLAFHGGRGGGHRR